MESELAKGNAGESVGVATDAAFVPPDWTLAFDVPAHLALVPSEATVKGMFWNDLNKVAERAGVNLPPGRFAAFKDYPLVDYMRAVADVARRAYPGASVASAIRQVGQRGFSTLANSLGGRVLFAISGRDLAATLGLVSEAYQRCLSPGQARLVEIEPGRAVIELRDLWNYPLSFQVGVFEGVMAHFGHTGSVRLRVLSPCDVDYVLTWR